MQFPLDTCRGNLAGLSCGREHVRIQLRHDLLSYRGAVVLLRYAELVDLPETPDLTLSLLKHVHVNIANVNAAVGGVENDF